DPGADPGAGQERRANRVARDAHARGTHCRIQRDWAKGHRAQGGGPGRGDVLPDGRRRPEAFCTAGIENAQSAGAKEIELDLRKPKDAGATNDDPRSLAYWWSYARVRCLARRSTKD